MNKERINHLCESYLNDSASAEELQELEAAFHDPSLEEEVKVVLAEVYARFPKDNYADLDLKVANHIFDNISIRINEKATVRLWHKIGVAVAVAAMIFGAGLFYVSRQAGEQGNLAGVYQNDVAPGKAGATLTLANGKKIRLNDAGNGKIAKEAGVNISKTAGGQIIYEIAAHATNDDSDQFNTLSTARGETYVLTLPDHSKVWLNAASSLTYNPKLMERGVRRVRLTGEAYFEISKDKAHPFVVATDKQEVEVLGTHFNINAYTDENSTMTTLLEGSVRISSLSGSDPSLRGGTTKQSKILKPNQQSVLQGETISVSNVDTDLSVAWKNGMFLFENEGLESVMNKISRWYDVDVVYEDGKTSNEIFSGGVTRYEKVSTVLRMLEKAGDVKFKIEGRRITVMK